MVTAEDTTPEHAAACQRCMDEGGGFYNAGPFTPFMFHEDGAPPKSTISVSGRDRRRQLGRHGDRSDDRLRVRELARHVARRLGGEEGSGSDLQLRHRGFAAGRLRSRQRERRRAVLHVFGARRQYDASGQTSATALPCQRPPWAKLVAVNANTGEIAWRACSASTKRCRKASDSAASGSAGPTVTAGGLVFVGATNDRRFRAFDGKTGKELWTTKLENKPRTRTR